jgi:hypothetical protein
VQAQRFASASHSLVPLAVLVKRSQLEQLAAWPSAAQLLPVQQHSLKPTGPMLRQGWPESWGESPPPTAADMSPQPTQESPCAAQAQQPGGHLTAAQQLLERTARQA